MKKNLYYLCIIITLVVSFRECSKGWYQVLMDTDMQTGVMRSANPFEVSIYFAMLVVSQAGYARIYAYTIIEMVIMCLFFIIGVLTFSYLVADYSATLMLANETL